MLTEQKLKEAYIDRNKLIEKLRNDRTGTNSEYHRGYNACLDELFDELEEGRFDDNSLQDTIQQQREERDKYRQEAMQERELSESIVAEREQLYIQVEEMKNKQAEMVREFWLIYSVTNNGSRANKRAHKAFQTFKPHD